MEMEFDMIIISDQSNQERQLLFHNNNRTTDFTSDLDHKYLCLYTEMSYFLKIQKI